MLHPTMLNDVRPTCWLRLNRPSSVELRCNLHEKLHRVTGPLFGLVCALLFCALFFWHFYFAHCFSLRTFILRTVSLFIWPCLRTVFLFIDCIFL